ncbi:RES domain-containing protein [Burkholderia pseudomallei]
MRVERHFLRDRTYGNWHRAPSIIRFLPARDAEGMVMVDLDSVLFVEHDSEQKIPLCLVEAARDIGQTTKPTGIIRALAERANLPAFVVLYEPSDCPNPANENWSDVESFRVMRIWPRPERTWRVLTPEQWARGLVAIRDWQLRRATIAEAVNDPHFNVAE